MFELITSTCKDRQKIETSVESHLDIYAKREECFTKEVIDKRLDSFRSQKLKQHKL